MEKMNMEKVKKIGGIVLNVIIWIILVISILATVLAFSKMNSEDQVPSLFGKSLITISSESMEPTFKKGALVIMTKLSDEEKLNLKKGDIITYHAPIDIDGDGNIGDINTHRIDEDPAENSLTVKTKGDHNPAQDNYIVHHSDIIGICRERSVPGVGAIISFLQEPLGFFLCIVLPLILFFLYELYRFIALVVSERAKRAPVSKEAEEEIRQKAIEEYLKQQQEQQNHSKHEDSKDEDK